jgi:hypothetical protein
LTVYRCANCNAPYCKNVCQDRDWNKHKLICPRTIQRMIIQSNRIDMNFVGKVLLFYTEKRGYHIDYTVRWDSGIHTCLSCLKPIKMSGGYFNIKYESNDNSITYGVCGKIECHNIHEFCGMPHPVGACLLLPGFLLLMKHSPYKLPKDLWKMIYNIITL